jgi:hypothetical protein
MADRQKDKEVRDAFVMQAVLVLHSNRWPENGRILVECSLLRNRALLEQLGGPHMDIVMLDRWMAKFLIQASQQYGLGRVIASTFSFEGSTLYVVPLPEHFLKQKQTFADTTLHYPHAVPVGKLAPMGIASSVQALKVRPGKRGKKSS